MLSDPQNQNILKKHQSLIMSLTTVISLFWFYVVGRIDFGLIVK